MASPDGERHPALTPHRPGGRYNTTLATPSVDIGESRPGKARQVSVICDDESRGGQGKGEGDSVALQVYHKR